jgi:hypothetical protein
VNSEEGKSPLYRRQVDFTRKSCEISILGANPTVNILILLSVVEPKLAGRKSKTAFIQA